MPYRIVTKDGIVIDDIPDGVAKDDQRLKDTVAQLRAAGKKQASFVYQPQAEEPLPVPAKEKSSVGEFMEGAAKGLKEGSTALLRGAAGGVASAVGVFSDPITALINQVLPEEYRGKVAREAVQDLLTKAGIPENETAAQRIVQAGAEGFAGAVTQAGAGQAIVKGTSLAPSLAKQVGATLAAQPAQEAAGGIGAGVASQAAAEAGAGAGVQTAAALGGSLLGSGVAGKISPEAIPDWNPQTQLVKTGEKAGVDLSTTDVFQPKTAPGKWAQSFGENIPFFGTGGMQKAKAAQRIEAVKDYASAIGADGIANASDDVMRDLLSTRKAEFAKWGGNKAAVLKSEKLTGKTVPMTNTLKKIDDQVEYLSSLENDSLISVINKLEGYRKSFTNKTIGRVEDNRKEVGLLFKDPNLVVSKNIKQKVIDSLYGSIKKDIGTFIKQNSGETDLNKWAQADTELEKLIKVAELPILKKAIKSGKVTPELIDGVLLNKNESTVQSLFKNLSPEGVKASKSALVQKALKDSIDEKTKLVNPNMFLSTMGKLETQTGIFFTDSDKAAFNGLRKVLNATEHAPEALHSPATGVRFVMPGSAGIIASIIPGGTIEKVAGTIAGMALAGGAARLYESKAVRDQLIKIANAKPGSELEAQLVRRVLETIRAKGEEENK